jgi:Xaa-Pro aminopeptidase
MAIATFHPVLIHGRNAWDLAELPRDEYEERLRKARALLAERGLVACVVLGSTTSYANLAYLSGVRPGFMSSVMLVHLEHDTVVFAGLGGGRDLYHVRATNFVDDVRYYPSPGEGVVAVLGEWGLGAGPIGIVGAHGDVPFAMAARIDKALASYELVRLDDAFFQLRRAKRPRERALLQRSAELVAKATDAAIAEFIATKTPYKAAIAAERAARLGGARDVRTLANLGEGPELRPITGTSGPLARRLVLHVGLERAGYWAEATLSFPRQSAGAEVAQAIAAMRAAIRPKAALSAVAEAGLACLKHTSARALAQDVGLGQGIGLGTEEQLALTPSSKAVLEGGEVLSLRCVSEDEGGWNADSSLVEVTKDGARSLLDSRWS